jgi:hypothetical protein
VGIANVHLHHSMSHPLLDDLHMGQGGSVRNFVYEGKTS